MNNTYFILRHGEAKSNKEKFISSWPEKVKNPLTKKGIEQVKKIISKIKKENIDLIFSSDLLRTKQTAEIVAKELRLEINFNKKLREHNVGIFNSKSEAEWLNFVAKSNRFKNRPPKGENWPDIKKRVASFIKEIEKKHKKKNILIISHQDILLLFEAVIKKIKDKELIINRNKIRIKTAELRKLT